MPLLAAKEVRLDQIRVVSAFAGAPVRTIAEFKWSAADGGSLPPFDHEDQRSISILSADQQHGMEVPHKGVLRSS